MGGKDGHTNQSQVWIWIILKFPKGNKLKKIQVQGTKKGT